MEQNKSDNAESKEAKAANSTTASKEQAIDFQGRAGEYFGIWIVNVLLTLITIGIYSAWAKVRRITYFHNRTLIDGHPLLYHATGWRILKGRLIVIALLAAFQAVVFLVSLGLPWAGELLASAAIPAFVILSPLAINATLRFQSRMTSYRNIRFNWHGDFNSTMKTLVVGPMIGLITLGILHPWMMKRYYAYFATNHSYGTTKFEAEADLTEFYSTYLLGVVLPAGVIAVLYATGYTLLTLPLGIYSGVVMLLALFGWFFAMYLVFSVMIYPVLCRNMLLNTMRLGGVVEFRSDVRPVRFVWIQVTNILAVIFSLGMAYPWTNVRTYRYLTSRTFLTVTGDVGKFLGEREKEQSAFGEEFAGFADIEVGI